MPLRLGGGRTRATQLLEHLEGAQGNAFTTESGTILKAENIATARLFAGVLNAAEKVSNGAIPGTSPIDALYAWAKRLGVSVSLNDKPSDIRKACAAKYRAQVGPTVTNENDALAELLGSAYLNVTRFEGSDLANPPYPTLWNGVNPGPATADLGGDAGGAWFSGRCHLLVNVQQPQGMPWDDFMFLINVRLFDMLDQMLPASSTFNWNLGVYNGFQLNVDKLDYNAL